MGGYSPVNFRYLHNNIAMKQLFLLDAYALIYRAYYGFINKPLVNSKGLNTGPIYGFLKTLQDVLSTDLTVDGNRIQPTHLAVCFDPKGGTFRHREFPTYKAQREAQPEAITEAVPYIKRLIEAYNIPIIEVAAVYSSQSRSALDTRFLECLRSWQNMALSEPSRSSTISD